MSTDGARSASTSRPSARSDDAATTAQVGRPSSISIGMLGPRKAPTSRAPVSSTSTCDMRSSESGSSALTADTAMAPASIHRAARDARSRIALDGPAKITTSAPPMACSRSAVTSTPGASARPGLIRSCRRVRRISSAAEASPQNSRHRRPPAAATCASAVPIVLQPTTATCETCVEHIRTHRRDCIVFRPGRSRAISTDEPHGPTYTMGIGEPTPWSGDDLPSWISDIRNGYSRAYVIHALRATGVLEALRRAGLDGLPVSELAAQCRVDAALLEGVLHYLAFADAVLDKRGDRFCLGERGAWLFDPSLEQSMLTFIDAYGCVMTELLPALRGDRRYGVDFVRSGEAVAVLSHLGLKATYGWVANELARVNTRVAADLGCGSAEALIAFCQARPDLRGVGIDISSSALEEAERRIAAAGLADRISLVWGDVTRPETLETPALDTVDTFTCTTVLHEFLRDGEDAVIHILQNLATRFPRRHLIIGEFDALSDEEYRAMPVRARVRKLWYQFLMHPLSLQGSPLPRQAWIALFERAGLEVLAVRPTDGDFFVDYFTLRLP